MPDILEVSREHPLKTIQAGDPWTFILEEPLTAWPSSDTLELGEVIAHWFGGEQLIFRVTSINRPATYETVFTGERV